MGKFAKFLSLCAGLFNLVLATNNAVVAYTLGRVLQESNVSYNFMYSYLFVLGSVVVSLLSFLFFFFLRKQEKKGVFPSYALWVSIALGLLPIAFFRLLFFPVIVSPLYNLTTSFQ